MSDDPIRIVLIDDHQMVRDALGRALDATPGLEVVGQAATLAEAMAVIGAARPDVAVVDYSFPGGGALPLIATIQQRWRPIRIVVLTLHASSHYAVRAVEAGADAFVVKASPVMELEQAILAAHRGEVFITPSLSAEVLRQLSKPRTQRVGVDALSPREFELLRHLGSGLGLGDAAKAAKVSTSAASTYRSRIMHKLSLTSTAELIRFALEHDIVQPNNGVTGATRRPE